MEVKVICDECGRIFETEDSKNFDTLWGDKIFLDAICPYCEGEAMKEKAGGRLDWFAPKKIKGEILSEIRTNLTNICRLRVRGV